MSEKKPQNLEIDNLDKEILSILMADATIPYTEIAKRLIISGGTVHVRMKKMQDMGIIEGSLKEVKEIVELHYCTGAYSMFAKIICKDTSHLRRVLNDGIQAAPGIQRTETFISLEESIKRQIQIA